MGVTLLKAAAEMQDIENEPECLTRDNLTSDYFPSITQGTFACVGVLCAIFFFTSLNRLNHTDLWGHLCFGRWIVEHGQLPATDPFNATSQPTAVLPYCWLGQVAGYEMWRIGGNDGLILAHAAFETLAAAIVMLAVWRRGAKGYWPALAGLCFVLLSLPILGTIRPQLFSQVAMALVLLACAELPTMRRPLVWLPIVFALWANLHATMIIGLGAIGVMMAGEIWRVWQEKPGVQNVLADGVVRRFGLALVLSLAGACLNPHGPLMFIEALTFGRTGAVNRVSEWQPMTPLSMTGILLIVSAAIAFLVIVSVKNKHPLKWHELALLALFGIATLGAIRMLVWWALVWPYVVVPMIALLWQDRKSAAPAKEDSGAVADEPTSMRTVMAMGIVFATLISAPPTHSLLHSQERGLVKTVSTDTPYRVAGEIARRKLSGSFIAPTDWADYVVWQSHDQMKPFVYGHFHLAKPEDSRDYYQIIHEAKDWLKLARQHDIKYILAGRQRNVDLAKALITSPDVRIVYQDKKTLLAEVLPPPPKPAQPEKAPAVPAQPAPASADQPQ